MEKRKDLNNPREPPENNQNSESMQQEESMLAEDPPNEEALNKTSIELLKFDGLGTNTDLSKPEAGIFYINKFLYAEQQQASKTLSSLTSFGQQSKNRLVYSWDPNLLFISSSNKKAQSYQTFIPNKVVDTFEMGSRIHNAKFTRAGDLFLATSQIGTSIFDLTSKNTFKIRKTIACNNISWAITDSDFTKDNRFIIHSTLSPLIQLFDLEKQKYVEQINMDKTSDGESNLLHQSFKIFTARISSDGKEIVSGTSRFLNGGARLQIYDVEQKKLLKSINAHQNDINSICYVDRENSSLIITGSDDGLCKLWDTRALGAPKPAGIFYGHLSGITYVSSREDNRYFITNSKDQSIKLWDLRKFRTDEMTYHHFWFEYRMEKLSSSEITKIKRAMSINPNEDSVATFFGHQVYTTLIRCHFSPRANTDQRFIYSGSADGCVYVYDVLANQLAAKLDVSNEKPIRDCDWHPFEQSIFTTDFSGKICKWDHVDLGLIK